MALKVKAVERLVKFSEMNAGQVLKQKKLLSD